jgi:hypothetical protein
MMIYREVGLLLVIPAKAGIQGPKYQQLPWTPASAGVTAEKP